MAKVEVYANLIITITWPFRVAHSDKVEMKPVRAALRAIAILVKQARGFLATDTSSSMWFEQLYAEYLICGRALENAHAYDFLVHEADMPSPSVADRAAGTYHACATIIAQAHMPLFLSEEKEGRTWVRKVGFAMGAAMKAAASAEGTATIMKAYADGKGDVYGVPFGDILGLEADAIVGLNKTAANLHEFIAHYHH